MLDLTLPQEELEKGVAQATASIVERHAEEEAQRQGAEWDTEITRSPFFQIEPLGLAFSGEAPDALTRTRTLGRLDENDSSILQVGKARIRALEENGFKTLGVGESKLLNAGIQSFTKVNTTNGNTLALRVTLDTASFARARGYDIVPRHMDSAEAQAAEDKRADYELKNFLKKIRAEIHNLRINAALSWTEEMQGKIEPFAEIGFVSGGKAGPKVIELEFSLTAGEYLVRRPLRQIPASLYLVDERKPNAYAIGVKLNQHYSMDHNVLHGTEDFISVTSLLAVTSLPTIDKIKAGKSKRGWADQIKEPFEKALDELTRIGFLKANGWQYSYPKRRILTDEEAANIATYEEFAGLYLQFEIEEYPAHSSRKKLIEGKIEERKHEAAAKAKTTRRKRKGKAKAAAEGEDAG